MKVAEPAPTVARLVVRPEKGLAPLGIQADASESSPAPGALIESYQFDFGEGNPEDPQQKPEATHTYKEGGKYTVTVTVTDSNDNSSAISRPVIVTGIPKPKIVEPTGNRASPGESVHFRGVASDPEDGQLTGPALEWYSSEDGFLGSGNEITVELSASPTPCKGRTHQISLVATDSDGNEVSVPKQFTVVLVDPDC